MSGRVCLVTTGQPACNPRLVKEADALAEAGFDVHVVAAYSADWATDADRDLVKSRRWRRVWRHRGFRRAARRTRRYRALRLS